MRYLKYGSLEAVAAISASASMRPAIGSHVPETRDARAFSGMEHLQEKSPHDTVMSPRFTPTGASGSASMSSPIFAMSPAEVVDKLQSIRLNGCPAEFVDAYRDYIKGWEALVAVAKKMYAQNMQKASSDIATFVSDYQSKPIEATVNLKKQWPAFSSDIDAATAKLSKNFAAMTAVGAKYNAVYQKDSSLF